MGRSYDQLSLDDRCEIARLFANGSSVRQIAAALDRSPSTISRELKRNSGAQVGYRSSYADQQTRVRHGTAELQFPVCNSPKRSQVLPLKRMNCIWSTGTWSVGEVLILMPGSSIGSSRLLMQ